MTATTQGEMNLDELSAIMNLQRQEAFDDATEALHSNLSKRGSLLSKKGMPPRPNSGDNTNSPEPQQENAEEKLLKIIASQTGSQSGKSPKIASDGRSSRRSSTQERRERSRSRPRLKERSASRPNLGSDPSHRRASSRDLSASSGPSNRERRSSSRPRPSSRPKGTVSDSNVMANMHKSMGALALDLEEEPKRNNSGSRRPENPRDMFSKSKSSRNYKSSSDIGNMMGNSRRSSRKDGRRHRSKSPVSLASIESSDSNNNSSSRRRGKRPSGKPASRQSSVISKSDSISENSSIENNGGPPKSKRESLRDSKSRRSSRRVLSDSGAIEPPGTFDDIWNDGPPSPSQKQGKRPSSSSLDGHLHKDPDTDSPSERSKSTLSLGGSGPDVPRPKKTKLEKIHELQAKCDRYKKEWIDATKGKKQLRHEVQQGKAEILSLSKQIDIHISETTILQKKLSEALQKLDEVTEDQRNERNEFSTTAKELAESRIEFTKALNDSRELKAEMDRLEELLREKDRTIADLEDELRETKIKAEDLDSDLNFAEETALKLEESMKQIERELAEYRAAAEKDASEGGNGEHMQQVRDDMERRIHEDRERRLDEKQKKLDEKMKQFEDERERYLEKEREREQEMAKEKRRLGEKSKLRAEERTRMDDEISEQLKTLEADNTMLQGRLKSEQLETTVKLRQKDDRIESLQSQFDQVQKQLSEISADPNGTTSLKKEVDAAKAEANSLKDELQEAHKHTGMLNEEVEELKSGKKDLQQEMRALQAKVTSLEKESGTWQKKSAEWEAKSGEWTDKAHQWKEKAEELEKASREAESVDSEPEQADPQALFLQAALEKKKATEATQVQGSKWNMLGNLLGAGRVASEDVGEAQERITDLEAENARQAEIIKNLRSEMIKMQTTFKEEAYTNQQKIQEVTKERDAVELKNANLMKELELARKLENFASQDM